MKALKLIVMGFWFGVGAEGSALALYLLWMLLHGWVGHKFDAVHLFHKIHEYFK